MSERCLEVKLTLSGSRPHLFVFERSPVLIGRGASCELCVPLKSVSAQHLALSWTQARLTARDLNAKNKAEHCGAPLTGEVSHSNRLTLSLPGALVEARLVPLRSRGTSHSERNHHLRSLWSAADGWLLEWQNHPKPSVDLPTDLPPLELIPLPFGERLALRAEQVQPEGLPATLLELGFSIESAEWGLTITEPSGAQHTLRAGEALMTSSGRLSLAPAGAPQPQRPSTRSARSNGGALTLMYFLIGALLMWLLLRLD